MSTREKRVNLIRQIEEIRNSSVICYVTGDRENIGTRIAPDIIRVFYRHLEKSGNKKSVDLFLYTRGGDVLTPWRLVNLIREYASRFGVLVPFRAYSAGTLVCLGADEIVMGKMGELGPIDPSVVNAFNPQDPSNPMAKIPVSVEDVSSYIALARSGASIYGEEYMSEIFRQLVDKVHPLALGNVHRNYLLIRYVARNLLAMHLPASGQELIQLIIDSLTEKLYAHNYMISRREAKEDIKLNIIFPEADLENAIWGLYELYEDVLQLREPFNPNYLLQKREQLVDFEASGGYIESRECLDSFIFEGTITKTGSEGKAPHVNVDIIRQGWQEIY
ncbi:MAG: SDH family Clp fold serine proteinase [Bacillota bacterium]